MIQTLMKILGTPVNTATYPLADASSGGATGSAGLRRCVWPSNGAFGPMVIWADVAPGAGTSVTVTLRKLAADTVVTATISDTNTTARYTGTALTVVAGEIFEYRVTTSGAFATTQLRVALEFNSFGDNTISCYSVNIGTRETGFLGPFMMLDSATLTYGIQQWVGSPGYVTSLWGANTFVNVTAGNILNVYMYKNGVKQDGTGGTVDTKLAITNVAQNTALSKTFSLRVVRGDLLYIGMEESGTYPSSWTTIGMTFSSDIKHTFFLCGSSTNNPSASAVAYAKVGYPQTPNWSASELFVTLLKPGVQGFYLGQMYSSCDTSPGTAPNSRTITVRKNTTDTSVTATFTAANLIVDNTTGFTSYVDGDTLGAMSHTPFDTPTTTGILKWTLVLMGGPPEPNPILPGVPYVRSNPARFTIVQNLAGTPLSEGGAAIGIQSLPQYLARIAQTHSWVFSPQLGALLGDPLFQTDWPNPIYGRAPAIILDRQNVIEEAPVTPITNDWSTPIFTGRRQYIDLPNLLNTLLVPILTTPAPPNMLSPNPTILPPRQYPFWGMPLVIIAVLDGRPICLLADATEYELLAARDLLEYLADATEYELNGDGRECQ